MDTSAGHPPPSGGPVTVTLSQAAAALGVSERTVRRRIAKGALPSGWTAVDGRGGLIVTVTDARTLEPARLNAVSVTAPDIVAELRSQIETLHEELTAAREREAWLRQRVEQAEAERSELVARVPLALPPAPERRPWWRFWR